MYVEECSKHVNSLQGANQSSEKNKEGTQLPEGFAQHKGSAAPAGARINESASKVIANNKELRLICVQERRHDSERHG